MKSVNVTIQNKSLKPIEVSTHKTLLSSLQEAGLDLPYGCQYGGCITCAAKLIAGHVDQRAQVALNNRQPTDGYIILCVARPLTDCILEVGVDSHDKLFRNPFPEPSCSARTKADIARPKETKNDIYES